MEQPEKKKSHDFNIYYLNFSKVYEIAMMINNVILTKIETDKSSSFEEQYGYTSSISAQGTKQFLDGIKASISADARETKYSEQFAKIEITEDDKKRLYAFDYSSLSALRDIKRVFNNRLMDYFVEKGVL